MAAPTNPVKQPIAVARRVGYSAGDPQEGFNEANSQTFLQFSFVTLSSGLVAIATSPLSSSNKTIGLADRAGSNTSVSKPINVLLVCPDSMIYEGTLSKTGTTGVFAQTDVGLIYPVTLDTGSNNWYVDKTSTSTDGAIVLGLKTGQTTSTVDPRVFFKLTRGLLLGA